MSELLTGALGELEARLESGAGGTRADVEQIFACPDLISVGVVGESARKRLRGNRVTFGRVAVLPPGLELTDDAAAGAGEVRLSDAGGDADALVARVMAARACAGARPLTGFSLTELLALSGGDHMALADLARALAAAGLESTAEAPLDELGEAEMATEIVRAVLHGGLGVWRATAARAPLAQRVEIIERAALVQDATRAFRAFAPLPVVDPRESPATGYDDVRTVAAARVRCGSIPSIQVDWALYGPKLAQVAIAYGADDLDNVSAVDLLQLGHRRSPREDLERQIRSAFAEPAERNGRFEIR
jgi:aminodeoxyfutalosine synthase